MPLDTRSLPRTVRWLTLAVAALAVVMTAFATGIVLLVATSGRAVDELRRIQMSLTRVDETGEALRADLLSVQDGDAGARDDVRTDLVELRSAIRQVDRADVPGELRPAIESVLAAQRELAREVTTLSDGTAGQHAGHVEAAVEEVRAQDRRLEAVAQDVGEAATAAQTSNRGKLRERLGVLAAAALVVAVVLVLLLRRVLLGAVRTTMTGLEQGFQDQEQSARLGRALDQAETEAEVHAVVAMATGAVAGDRTSQLVVAGGDDGRLDRIGCDEQASAFCGVTEATACPVMRAGRSRATSASSDLDGCPRMRDRPGEPVSAVCVPVSFLGRSLGVLQLVGRVGDLPDDRALAALDDIAHQAGIRLGTMRALTLAQQQARVDPLTGLLNRRTLEDQVRELVRVDSHYAVAMLDLDHFKALNDTHGHDIGDRALTTFASVLRRTLRDEDVIARYGGEEFVVVFPGTESTGAWTALEHVREQLAESVRASGVVFTFSGGITDTNTTADWRQQLRIADEALMRAKHAGRDRLLLGDAVAERRAGSVDR